MDPLRNRLNTSGLTLFCPEIGAKLNDFAKKGLTTIMLDMVADEAEMQHVCKALAASGVF